MFNTLKKINPFNKKTNYKELYEKEVKRREELEEIHRYISKQMTSVLDESKQKYQFYKFKDKEI
jgi:hypothetical protein